MSIQQKYNSTVDETRECLSRQMMLTYSVWYTANQLRILPVSFIYFSSTFQSWKNEFIFMELLVLTYFVNSSIAVAWWDTVVQTEINKSAHSGGNVLPWLILLPQRIVEWARACLGFVIGGQGRRARAGAGFLGRVQQPLPPVRGLGSAVSSLSGVWGGAPTAQRFSTISTRMASPDTIILLIVDYHAAIGGGQDPPCTPLCRPTPLKMSCPNADIAIRWIILRLGRLPLAVCNSVENL